MRSHPAVTLLLPVVLATALLGCAQDEVPPEAVCRSRHRVPADSLAKEDQAAVEMTYARCEPWFVDMCDGLEDYLKVVGAPLEAAMGEGYSPGVATEIRERVGSARLAALVGAVLAPVAATEGSVARDLEVAIRIAPGGPDDMRPPPVSDGDAARIRDRWYAALDACVGVPGAAAAGLGPTAPAPEPGG